MPASGYTVITFVANQLLTSTVMNQMGANDAAFNNGNGFNDGIIINRHLGTAAVKDTNMDYSTVTTFKDIKSLNSDVSISAASDTAIPGLGTVSVVADGKRHIRVTFKCFESWRGAGGIFACKIWENGVGGTLRAEHQSNAVAGVVTMPINLQYISLTVPAAGTYVFTVSIQAAAGSVANASGATIPMVLLAELF